MIVGDGVNGAAVGEISVATNGVGASVILVRSVVIEEGDIVGIPMESSKKEGKSLRDRDRALGVPVPIPSPNVGMVVGKSVKPGAMVSAGSSVDMSSLRDGGLVPLTIPPVLKVGIIVGSEGILFPSWPPLPPETSVGYIVGT